MFVFYGLSAILMSITVRVQNPIWLPDDVVAFFSLNGTNV